MSLGSLGSDNSVDAEDVRDELKNDLVLLTADLKRLNPYLDYSGIINPLLAAGGPAIAHIPRLQKQKVRMVKIRDNLLRTAEENEQGAPAERSGNSIPARPATFGHNRERQSSAPGETFRDSNSVVLPEVLPPWSPFKRFSDKIDRRTYDAACAVATWTFAVLQACDGGPYNCSLRKLPNAMPEGPQPPVERGKIEGFFTNRYLQFENIRDAVNANDINRIEIGYLRHPKRVAAAMAKNKGRNNFIAWAVARLQSLGHERAQTFTQDDLLAAWDALPEEVKTRMTKTKANTYFLSRSGVRLTMPELVARAFPHESLARPISPACDAADAASGETAEEWLGELPGEGWLGEADETGAGETPPTPSNSSNSSYAGVGYLHRFTYSKLKKINAPTHACSVRVWPLSAA